MLNQLVRATEVHGSGGIGDIEIREPEKKLEKEHGADFLIRTFMENDDISLITLGPLTNVAQAILKEPELKKRIPEDPLYGRFRHQRQRYSCCGV